MNWKKQATVVVILTLLTAFNAPGGNFDLAEQPMEVASPIDVESTRCNIMCWNCEGGTHFDRGTNVPEYQWRADPVHLELECEAEQTCEDAGHTENCEIGGATAFRNTGENYDAVRTMVATGELAEIAAALDADWVSYVAERRSIQMQSCTGTIIANLPVKPEWARTLEGVGDPLNTVTAP